MTQRIATAEWSNPEEFEKTHEFKTGDFWLGRSITPSATPLGFNDDRHVSLVSGNRGGKGTAFIVNNLCLWPGPVVCIDPKGENATVTARRRGKGSEFCEGMGQDVQVLDPMRTTTLEDSLRGSLNPLDSIDPTKPEAIRKANLIADAIVVVQNQKDPSWERRGRAMIQALILHVKTAPEYEGERNLLTVRKLLMRGDWKAVQAFVEMGEEKIPPSHHILWNSVRCNTALDVLPGLGERFLNMALYAAEQYEGVIDAAVEATNFLDDVLMQDCIKTSTFAPSDLKTNPKGISIYLCLPQLDMNTYSGWLRMMIALITYEMQLHPQMPACGHRVLMCIDEFAVLKRMDIIENNIAYIAGFKVKLFIVLQSLEQLKANYEKNWETLLANCSLKIFFDVGDHFSREYISKFIGETEVIRETQTKNVSKSVLHNVTQGEGRTATQTDQTSDTEGVSISNADSHSKTKSLQWGKNKNHGWTSGRNEGESWQPHPIVLRNTDRFFSLFRKGETANLGSHRSRSGGGGTSRGGSEADTDGTTQTLGLNASRTHGSSRAEAISTNQSVTEGTTDGESSGTNEVILKRALITPDEVAKHFGRVDNSDDPKYPGFALIVIGGENPIPVRRCYYFQEPELTALYDAHPDHPQTAPERLLFERAVMSPSRDVIDILQIPGSPQPYICKWFIEVGSDVAEGQLLFGVSNVRGNGNSVRVAADFESDEAYEKWRRLNCTVEGQILFHVSAPMNGVLSSIVVPEGPLQAEQPLAWLTVNRRTEYLESKNAILVQET